MDAASETGSTLPSPPFRDYKEEFAGSLHRKISRVQAISRSHKLTTWLKEWCVLSHNFLVFFASKTNLRVKKCLLLSTVHTVEELSDRSFHVVFNSQTGSLQEELILRVPSSGRNEVDSKTKRRAEVQQWVKEVWHRVEKVKSCGKKLMPCMSLSEARQVTDAFDEEIHKVAKNMASEAEGRIMAARCNALLVSVHAVVVAKNHMNMRHAFDELSLHARLKVVHGIQKSAAAQRLFRALERPRTRLLHGTFAHLKDLWVVLQTERKIVRCKQVHLGAMMLSALIRDREHDFAGLAHAKLHQHTKAAKGRSVLRHSVAVVAEQLRVGGQLLRIAMRNIEMSQREWALRTWCIALARTVSLETKELMHSTDELNRQLMDRRQRLPVESFIRSSVLLFRAAQQRRILFAFTTLKVAKPSIKRGPSCIPVSPSGD